MPKQRRTASQLRLVLRNGGKIPSARELAARAFAIRYDDAVEMLELAKLAVEQARFEPQEVQAFTLTHLGNAQRINGLFLEALSSFKEAEKLFGRPDPLLLQFRASLHQDRGQFRPAMACLRRAAKLATDREKRAIIKLKTAHVLELSGEHRAAIEVVIGTLDDIDNPEIVGAALHGLANYLTNAGEPERALFVLQKGLPFFEKMGQLARLRVLWFEGKLASVVGDLATALDCLQRVKQGFADRSLIQEVALLSLETAHAYARRKDLRAAQQELEGVPEILQALGIGPEETAARMLQIALKARTIEGLVEQLHGLFDLLTVRLPLPRK
jgi:tetratricopeptide (TPR) repeat protein